MLLDHISFKLMDLVCVIVIQEWFAALTKNKTQQFV